MELIKIKNVSGYIRTVIYGNTAVKELANDETLLITDEMLANNLDLITRLNNGEFTIIEPTGGWIISDVYTAEVTAAADFTINIPAGEIWLLASASLTTSAGTADLLLDGKKVIADADADPVVTVDTTTFGGVFKVSDTIKVDQKTATGTYTLTLKGTKVRSLM